MSPRRSRAARLEDEHEAFRRALAEVRANLPDDQFGIEGADVREVIRHGKGSNSAEARIARELANPHADIETELSEGTGFSDDTARRTKRR